MNAVTEGGVPRQSEDGASDQQAQVISEWELSAPAPLPRRGRGWRLSSIKTLEQGDSKSSWAGDHLRGWEA